MGSSIGDGAYLEDCIVGYGYAIRAGEIIKAAAARLFGVSLSCVKRYIRIAQRGEERSVAGAKEGGAEGRRR